MSEAAASVPAGTTVTEASTPAVTNASSVLEQHGLVEVSEADLRGPGPEASVSIEPPAQTAPPEPAKETEPIKEEEKKTEELSPEDKAAAEKTESKVPKGFVPTSALHEVRGENKYLKSQIAELTKQLNSGQPATVESPEDTFTVLTDEEFIALSDESPKEALLYMKHLNHHNEQKRVQETLTTQTQKLFDSVSKEMESVVPGLFSDDAVADEFRTFAETVGFTEDLFYLTNPSTMVILPGETEPVLLGDQAAKLIRVLATVKQGQKPTEVPDLAKIEANLRTKIETEILAKVKSGDTFRSLSAMPNAQETRPEFSDKVLSEAEFMKLSPKEQELYLSGQ